MVSPGEYGAWLFDLDEVITDTASVHAAWKSTFVIGVARGDGPEVLRKNGAHVVVRDLAELSLV